jgi:ElaB/YqjD/DUF883 family membrane-anchored ribosome-binding protein
MEVAMLIGTRERLADDLRAVLTQTEELLDALAEESKDGIADLRPRLRNTLRHAKRQLAHVEQTLERRAQHTARGVDVYVHENPWRTAGIAVGLGAVLGSVIGALMARR